MTAFPAEAVQAVGTGVVVVLIGYLIRFRQWTVLIAGYDASSPLADEVIADIVGSSLLRIGVATIAWGVLEALTTPPNYLGLIFAAAVLLEIGRVLYRIHTFTPETTATR